MKQRTLKAVFGVAIIVLTCAVVYLAVGKRAGLPTAQPTATIGANDTQTPSPTTPTPIFLTNTPEPIPSLTTNTAGPILQGDVYENEFMKVTIPAGWMAQQAVRIVWVGNCDNAGNCATTPKAEPNPTAANITKGKYILYVNTEAEQASGIIGGRFAEIAVGAPSADAVVIEQPSSECGFSETKPALPGHPRVDLYVGPGDAQPWCNVPTQATVWYFSYVANKAQGGYFNYYGEAGPLAYVITMAYNSKDVNRFPSKGSPELESMLEEMTAIIRSLEIKQK